MPSLTDGTQAGTIQGPSPFAAPATDGSQVPTTAPKVSASGTPASPNPVVAPTPAAPVPNATPTPIVSSQTATDHVQNTITPAMTSAEQAIADQNAARKASEANGYVYNVKQPDGTYYSGLKSAMPAAPTPTSTTANAQTSAEQQLASQPEAGYRFVYNNQGASVQVPVDTSTPSGYSDTNPNPPAAPTAQPTSSITTDTGTRVDMLPGGNIALYDAAGNFTGYGTQQDVTNAQNNSSQYQRDQAISQSNDTLTKIDAIANGSYPLTAGQQSQIDGLKAQYQALIDQQITANKNSQGATTLAENMYGMGNTLTGIGQISQVVSTGQQKVDDLNSKMNAAVAQMRTSFMKDDLTALQTAYTDYTNVVKDRQAAIDKLTSQVQTQAQQAAVDQAIGAQLTQGVADPVQILDALQKQGIAATAKQVNDALANLNPKQTAIASLLKTAATNGAKPDIINAIGNAKTLADAYAAAGIYSAGGSGLIGEYNVYLAGGGTATFTGFVQQLSGAKSTGSVIGKDAGTQAVSLNSTISIPIGSDAAQSNNIGGLKFVGQPGASAGQNGFAKFDTPGDGYTALVNQVRKYVNGNMSGINAQTTIADMVKTWASTSSAQGQSDWVNNVTSKLGVSADTKISSLDPVELANAIAYAETSTNILTMGLPDPSVTDPNVPQKTLGGQSLNDIKMDAQNYINLKGKMPSVGLGAGADAMAIRSAVMLMAGKISAGKPADQQVLYGALTKSQINMTSKLVATQAAETTALDNLSLAEQASKNLSRSPSQLLNIYQQMAQKNLTSSPGLTSLETYIYTAVREYGKVTSGGAASSQGLTDAQTSAASQLINAAQNPANFQAAIDAMKKDMTNSISGMTQEQSTISDVLNNLGQTGAGQAASETQAQSQIQTITASNPSAQAWVYNQLKENNPATGQPWTYPDLLQYGLASHHLSTSTPSS